MTIRPSEIIVTKESDASDLFTFQLDLIAEPTTSEGRHINDCESTVYLTTHILSDVPKGDWITDVTYESVELLGQPATETFEIAHEGFLR